MNEREIWARKEFEFWRETGYSKSETPSSMSIRQAMSALNKVEQIRECVNRLPIYSADGRRLVYSIKELLEDK